MWVLQGDVLELVACRGAFPGPSAVLEGLSVSSEALALLGVLCGVLEYSFYE